MSKINIDEALKSTSFELQYADIISRVDNLFVETVADVISVKADITDYIKDKIAEQYSENIKNRYIKDFLNEQVNELRELVNQSVFAGNRAENLNNILQERYNVSANKARFLARQETSLLTSVYRQARYQEVGLNKYKWSTSHDVRVRHDHAILNGKIFSYDNPPITNQLTGERSNPGEDFGCRCLAIPIME